MIKHPRMSVERKRAAGSAMATDSSRSRIWPSPKIGELMMPVEAAEELVEKGLFLVQETGSFDNVNLSTQNSFGRR
jgi:hypothetical protein